MSEQCDHVFLVDATCDECGYGAEYLLKKAADRIAALEKVAEAGIKLKTFHTAFADNNELVFYSIAARDAFDEHTETLRAAGYDITKEHIL